MKILMITSRYLPFNGGVEQHIYGIAKELTRIGHHVDILTLTNGKPLPAQDVINGIRVMRISSAAFGKMLQIKAASWGLLHIAWLRSYDVIHGHDLFLSGLVKVAKKPYFHTFHGYEGFPISNDSIVRRHNIEENAVATMCAGAFIKKWYQQRCDIIEWGAVNQPAPDLPVVRQSDLCFVGRLEKDTGITAYIEAVRLAKQHGKNLSLVVCGDGSLKHELEDKSRSEGLNVDFIGFTNNPLGYIKGTKVACVSGYLAILEAMSLKKVVAAHYDTPIKEDYLKLSPYAQDIIITNSTDYLYREIISYIGEPEAWQQKINRNYEFSQHNSWNNLAQQYISLYSRKHR